MATTVSGIPAANAVPRNNYKPKSFDNKKYSVDGYSYPNDLMGNIEQYGSNYVMFYINVNEASKMLENPNVALEDTDFDPDDRVKKQLAGKEYTKESVEIAQTVTGSSVGLVGLLSGGSAAVKTALVGGGVSLVSTKAIATNASGFSRAQKRLKTAIALHVPNQLSIRYGANWGEEETFGMQATQTGIEIAKALASSGASISDKTDAFVKGTSGIVASLALSKGPNAGAMSAMSGLAPNPMKEQTFKNVDFRTFSIAYSFAPRSEAESRDVLNIISAFKYHMHPEYKDANNFLFLYPSEFDVVYYHAGTENMNIHRHTSCVLTELNVDYAPNGSFSTFAGGMPTQINITMSFKELTILTKELIAQGL